MIHISESEHGFRFFADDAIAGEYVVDDRFKPYVHPLKTPRGHVISRASPCDHRHHKGLMYALCCADLNFWEEEPGQPDCGVQHVRSTEVNADGVSITQQLHWADEAGDKATYDETRTLSLACRGDAFVWSWRSQRIALRDHRVVQSPSSIDAEDGRTINYQGLGIRLPRAWAFPDDNMRGVVADGQQASPPHLEHGTTASSVTFWGAFDGYWSPPRGAVTFEQTHGFAHFLLDQPFGYLAVGPSNAAAFDVARGDTFDENYTIRASDLPGP